MLAEIYELEGGMRKAIDEYVQAIDINKQDYDSYYKIAYLLTQLDKKDEASQMLNSLLQKKPEYIKATELLGEILIEKEMYKEAVNIYQNALRFNPGSYDINYNLILVFLLPYKQKLVSHRYLHMINNQLLDILYKIINQ